MMTSIQENKRLKNAISRAFWLILWQLAALKVGKELILPSPFAVVKALGGPGRYRFVLAEHLCDDIKSTVRLLPGNRFGSNTGCADLQQ